MRTIIAGSRHIKSLVEVEKAMKDSGITPTAVLCGGAQGVDHLGRLWAKKRAIPVEMHLADWDTHGRAAGPIRNAEMAKAADALVLVWDGYSFGSADMLRRAKSEGLRIHTHYVQEESNR